MAHSGHSTVNYDRRAIPKPGFVRYRTQARKTYIISFGSVVRGTKEPSGFDRTDHPFPPVGTGPGRFLFESWLPPPMLYVFKIVRGSRDRHIASSIKSNFATNHAPAWRRMCVRCTVDFVGNRDSVASPTRSPAACARSAMRSVRFRQRR
jgi:hypothetical protein